MSIKDKLIDKLKALGVEFSEVKYEDIKCRDMRIMLSSITEKHSSHNELVRIMGFRAMYRHLGEDEV